jgi:tetratricopeptide (TPR) repeat protein
LAAAAGYETRRMSALTEPVAVGPVARTAADRYPGALPFGDTPLDRLRFFGREEEIQALLHQLLSVEVLVFFGRSGLGKTSLLNAALLPLLRKRDFLPVPVRLNELGKPPLQIVIDAVAETCRCEEIDYTPGRDGSLWEFFKTAIFWRGDRIQTPVMVLDQFEEVFTVQREEFRRELAAELGQLIASRLPEHLRQRLALQEAGESAFTEKLPPIKILISVREDYLGALQEFVPAIPGILLNRFRLTGLSEDDARRAVTEPAGLVSGDVPFSTAPFAYKTETLDQMIAAARDEEGGSIEPFVLQLLCSHVEKQMRQLQAVTSVELQVGSSYLGGGKGIRAITANFYFDALKRLRQPPLRRRARALCEEGLLTDAGRRRSMLQDDLQERFKLPQPALDTLESTRLIRREPRHGSFYYEISHDRLAEAIHQSRKWRVPREVQIILAIILIITIFAAVIYSSYQNSQATIARVQAQAESRRAEEAQKAKAAAEAAAQRATHARDEAEKLVEFMMFNLFDKLEPIGRLSLLYDVPKRAQDYYASFAGEEETPDMLRRQGAVYERIGDILRNRGDLKGALERYRDSFNIRQKLANRDSGNADWQRDLAASYEWIGDVLRDQGDLKGALERYRDSFNIRQKLANQDSGKTLWQRDLAASYERIGDVLRDQGNRKVALESQRHSFDIRQKLANQDPGNADWQSDLAFSYERIGDVLRDQGDLKGTLESQRHSFDIRQKLVAQDPGNARWQYNLALSYERIGDVLRDQGDLKGALKNQSDSFDIRQKLLAQDPGNARWQRDLAFSDERIGNVLRDQRDLKGALERQSDSFDIRQKLADRDPSNADWQRDLALSYERIGDVLRDQGDLKGALKKYHDALAIVQKLASQDSNDAVWQGDLAFAYWNAGELWSQVEADSKLKAREMIEKGRDILRDLRERVGLTAPQQSWLDAIEKRLEM